MSEIAMAKAKAMMKKAEQPKEEPTTWAPALYGIVQEPLNVEPPCKSCFFWNPVRLFDNHGQFVTLRCCHADQMVQDFSCWRDKNANPESQSAS